MYNASAPLVQARIWQGKKTEIPLGVTHDLYVTIPTGQYKRLQINMTVTNPLKAPVMQGQSYGTLDVVLNNQVIASQPLVALESSERGNMWHRATDSFRYNLHKYFSKNDDKVNTG
jgi:D-alanyl-D-alanine carboxypeptidase (penicillin-binding protein 5/6)